MIDDRTAVCATALADACRDDDGQLVSPMGRVPALGARLAKATFAPDILLTDGVASLIEGVPALGDEATCPVEAPLPYRQVFHTLWAGRRHVIMGAAQLDRYGNQNIASIGDPDRPKAMLLGPRGAPGNTLCHPTSYWIGNHGPRVFVPKVDVVCGVGNDRARSLGKAARFHALRVVVTNLAVLDFATPDGALRLRSVHPGVSVRDVLDATGFPLAVDDVGVTRTPTAAERAILDRLDPRGLAAREVRR